MNLTLILEKLDLIEKLIVEEPRKGWMDLRSACDYSKLSPSTIRRAIRRGVLKTSKSTGKLLFKRSDIDRWLRG